MSLPPASADFLLDIFFNLEDGCSTLLLIGLSQSYIKFHDHPEENVGSNMLNMFYSY
jgi:hypothetical protein